LDSVDSKYSLDSLDSVDSKYSLDSKNKVYKRLIGLNLHVLKLHPSKLITPKH
jgi:hypothetical protein